MKRIIFHLVISTFLFAFSISGFGQSFIFGPRGGFTLGTQSWNGFDRNVLLSYHGGAYIESYREEAPSSFLAHLGYHKRGSSERVVFIGSGGGLSNSRQSFEFNNVVLLLGAKKKIRTFNVNKPYYLIGVRLEYTLNTNLDQYEIYGGYFPLEPFVNKFNYGPVAAAGYELEFSEFVGGFIEASISPDISKQYEQPELFNIISPISGQVRNVNAQTIRNLTFEITLGLKLLRKVEFID
jgi:hypothetical protein